MQIIMVQALGNLTQRLANNQSKFYGTIGNWFASPEVTCMVDAEIQLGSATPEMRT